MNFVHGALTIPRPSKRHRLRARSNAGISFARNSRRRKFQPFVARQGASIQHFASILWQARLSQNFCRLAHRAFSNVSLSFTAKWELLKADFCKIVRLLPRCSVPMKVMRTRRSRSNNTESSILTYTCRLALPSCYYRSCEKWYSKIHVRAQSAYGSYTERVMEDLFDFTNFGDSYEYSTVMNTIQAILWYPAEYFFWNNIIYNNIIKQKNLFNEN